MQGSRVANPSVPGTEFKIGAAKHIPQIGRSANGPAGLLKHTGRDARPASNGIATRSVSRPWLALLRNARQCWRDARWGFRFVSRRPVRCFVRESASVVAARHVVIGCPTRWQWCVWGGARGSRRSFKISI